MAGANLGALFYIGCAGWNLPREHWPMFPVAADPSPISTGWTPGGWPGIHYWRLHGSPRIYHSDYEPDRLQALAQQVQNSVRAGITTWCIFDNTASGFALGNTLMLQACIDKLGIAYGSW